LNSQDPLFSVIHSYQYVSHFRSSGAYCVSVPVVGWYFDSTRLRQFCDHPVTTT
jgi:hypothetical protein